MVLYLLNKQLRENVKIKVKKKMKSKILITQF